ncbi:MAG: class I SAM-dependent methyltransferase [Clostridia bacterium]
MDKGNKGFWDRWAGRYDRTMSGNQNTYIQIVDRIRQALNRKMTVLELCCGTGILSVQIAGSTRLLEATDFL